MRRLLSNGTTYTKCYRRNGGIVIAAMKCLIKKLLRKTTTEQLVHSLSAIYKFLVALTQVLQRVCVSSSFKRVGGFPSTHVGMIAITLGPHYVLLCIKPKYLHNTSITFNIIEASR